MSEPIEPQLVMLRGNLEGLAEVVLPDGYALRTSRDGDEPAWARILTAAFDASPGKFDFNRFMRPCAEYRPERTWFLCRDGEPIATASAYPFGNVRPDACSLHWVGVHPDHQGRRLGYWVSLAALHQMRREGHARARLRTDDSRLAALWTYVRLDFEPLLVHENQRARWAAVFDRLGKPDLTDRFATILHGPVTPQPET